MTIGPQKIGGSWPIVPQSMLSVPLSEPQKCLEQIDQLLGAGCFLIRAAIPTSRSLKDFELVRSAISEKNAAFIADLQFGSELALLALDLFDKVRINPGNFATTRRLAASDYDEEIFLREKDSVEGQAKKFFQKAHRLRRAVRIGSNGGSISARMEWNCGRGVGAIIGGAIEMAQWALEENFHSLVFSFKSSGVFQTIEANILARKRMDELGWDYPFHLGVTEAGKGFRGRAAATIGCGTLLSHGLGDTLRVSLTEAPAAEINFAQKLLAFCEKTPIPFPAKAHATARIVDAPPDGHGVSVPAGRKPFDGDQYLLETSHLLLGSGDFDSVFIAPGANRSERREIVETLLQTCGFGKFSTEIIACPTCGRTAYDVAAVVDEISAKIGRYPGLRIAVMGCVVNGVGEMGDADYGYIGCGNGTVNLYCRGECAMRSIPEKNAVDELMKLMEIDGNCDLKNSSGT